MKRLYIESASDPDRGPEREREREQQSREISRAPFFNALRLPSREHLMERSRSPPAARDHFLLFGESPGQRLSLEDLLRTHGRRTREAPWILPSGKVVPVDALFDWRRGDASIADDEAFRWQDKLRFEDRLQVLNATPRDHRCVFEELTHTYYVDGKQVPWSATTFSHGCEKGFDADAFLKTATASWAVSRGYCDEQGQALSPESIKSLWERNGTIQSRRGTLLHWHIECHLNGHRIEEPHSPEFQLFLKFQEHFLKPMGFVPWRVEMNLFHCGLQLSGQADLVCKDAGDRLVILDWKRSKKISEEGYRGERQRPPLAHLPNCNRQCYNLQLNAYRHILEKEYLLPVSGMYLVILHPDQVPALPFVMKVPRMELEIEALVRKAVEERGVRGDDLPDADAVFTVGAQTTEGERQEEPSVR